MQPIGELKKITVAVVADDWVTVASNGRETRTEMVEEDFDLIRGIVREAIGFDEERGDSISVYNKSFQTIAVDELPEIPIWKQDWFGSIIKQVLAGIAVLIIIFTVVRPTMKTLRNSLTETGADNTNKQLPPAVAGASITDAQNSDFTMQGAHGFAQPNYVEQLAMAKKLVDKDSRQVAKVVKNWVAE